MDNQTSSYHFLRWFDPRNRQVGTWAFILNRITALGLTLYLAIHLVALSQLAQGPDVYDAFIAFAKNPFFKLGEMLVIAAGIIHGLNGVRLALNSFGIGVRYQKQFFLALMVLAVIAIGYFGFIMFISG